MERMTDKEIIKALEHHKKRRCFECPLRDNEKSCSVTISTLALDLINRQQAQIETMLEDLQFRTNQVIEQQAEIERLKKVDEAYPCKVDVGNNCLVYAKTLDDYDRLIGDISAEAIKEYADILAEKFIVLFNLEYNQAENLRMIVKQMAKKMVGEQE